MIKNSSQIWQVWIDTGGTFTDCIAIDPVGKQKTAKVLSSSALRGEICESAGLPNSYKIIQQWNAPDDFVQGFHFRLLDIPNVELTVTGFDAEQSILQLDKPLPQGVEFGAFEVKSSEQAPVLAARLVTATLPDEELPPMNIRLATTKATNALLEKKGASTALFMTKGFEDLLTIGTQQRPDLFAMQIQKNEPISEKVVSVNERMDADGHIIKPLECSELTSTVERLLGQGITSAAVSLMHSYKRDKHERELKDWLLGQGFDHVSISSDLSSFIGILARSETTLVNAYLGQIIHQYLDDVQSAIPGKQVYVMTSAGGLRLKQNYTPKDSLLSGPAGGVVGAAAAGARTGIQKIISFDMGGTSTDVSRYNSNFDYIFEHQVGEAHLVAPALNIETVAAGGGSICSFDGHKICVGPDSAGAHPGPACYGAGGPLTLTDVNLLLGRLDERNFHIPVDRNAAEEALQNILDQVNAGESKNMSGQEVLSGFLSIANERMADAIRKVSVRKGYDIREYSLVAFGGAGGQHACAIARQLGIETVLIPPAAGLLSASGVGHANIEEFAEQQILQLLGDIGNELEEICIELGKQAKAKLSKAGFKQKRIQISRKILSMRLEGQETSLDIDYHENMQPGKAFKEAYKEQYGHWIDDHRIQVEGVRVVAAVVHNIEEQSIDSTAEATADPQFEKKIWFDGNRKMSPVFNRDNLLSGQKITGPALILDPHSTIVVEKGWEVDVTSQGALKMSKQSISNRSITKVKSDVANVELFTNRFGSIAEEMGEMLQRTAFSVNVKERLDFSCVLLNSGGQLVVNAPHIPVHLGALGLCVRKLIQTISMNPGDVVVSNHPAYGGSHLPDVTVVTPIYIDDDQLVGYAASRAHHAEIGGAAPGSMPPNATSLEEEGVVIPPMYAVRDGVQQWDKIRSQLLSGTYPTRSIQENMADLKAQTAANQRGVRALQKLCSDYGFEKVRYYMDALRGQARSKMENTIQQLQSGSYISEEFLDDGTPLKVSMEIQDQEMSLDFTGTGSVHPNNLNATPAIVNSVVMYVLRLLINEPIPLNDGILDPVNITLPECLLNPSFDRDPAECPAVVGGNIEVSQRLVDTLLKPFGQIACSQGTMNNVLFGNENFGYYETVGGGTGAGSEFDGTDAVHHHMTNTRGTDPEILEHRYPVRLDEYAIRKGSGGNGKWKGGDGIYRKTTFLEAVELTVLTQHRRNAPYGIAKGQPGQKGEQWVVYENGKREQLNSIDGRSLQKGDQFILKTPGGGGFGDNNHSE